MTPCSCAIPTLQAHKYPTPTIHFNPGGRQERALIICRGWLDTLDWRYWANAAGLEKYEHLGSEVREIGEDDRPIFAQSFQLSSSSGWTATTIWIRLYKVGSPTDNLVVSLKSDSAGDPGTTLASKAIAGADVGSRMAWTEFELSSPVALSTGTTYWIHVARSGSISLSNYFVIGLNIENGYENGSPEYYNTNLSKWVSAEHKGEMNFRVLGNLSTTTQIEQLISGIGAFFNGTEIVNVSGVNTQPYRDGDRRGLYELRKYLETGTTNDRRLLCEVTRGRVLRVFEEPARPAVSTSAYRLSGRGRLFSPKGREAEPSDCTVGVWANLADVVPASVDLSRISDPSLFFIEEAEYDAELDRYRIVRTRDQGDVFDIGGVG